MPPLLADFIHAGACIPICEKFLTRPTKPWMLNNASTVFLSSVILLEVLLNTQNVILPLVGRV